MGAGFEQAADAAGHLLAAHIPFVTLVISSVREIRRHREYHTTLAESVGNVALDVGGVMAGVAAAAALGAAIPGPHILLTVPGAVAGKMAVQKVRKVLLDKAVAQYDEAKTEHDATLERLVDEFGAAVDERLTAGRDQCAQLPPPPRPRDVIAVSAHLSGFLHDYRTVVENVLAVAHRIDPTALDPTRRDAAQAALARAEELLGGGEPGMVELVAVPLPGHACWGPSHELASTCASAARVLRDRADEHHQQLGHWVHDVAGAVEQRQRQIREAVERAVAVLDEGRTAAGAALTEAARAVDTRRSALHMRPRPSSG